VIQYPKSLTIVFSIWYMAYEDLYYSGIFIIILSLQRDRKFLVCHASDSHFLFLRYQMGVMLGYVILPVIRHLFVAASETLTR
jgi:uncharacterized membrane protein